jgi:hypothetical protein
MMPQFLSKEEQELKRLGHGTDPIFVFGDNGEPSHTSIVGDGVWDTTRNRKLTYEYIRRKSVETTKAKNKQCIVKGCTNLRYDPEKPEECYAHGLFYGEMCAPCSAFITDGEGKDSQAYRNSLLIAALALRDLTKP